MAVVLSAVPGIAETDCPPFPKVTFWGDLSHESVRRHVAGERAGDWQAYLDLLQRQQRTLQGIHNRGSGAAINRQGKTIRLAGKQLEKYLAYADRRIAVIRCLAEAAEINGLADFSTAAGTPADAPLVEPRAERRAKPVTEPRGEAGDTKKSLADKGMERTFITLPKETMAILRKKAVRRSVKEARKTTVNDIIVEILEREARRSRR